MAPVEIHTNVLKYLVGVAGVRYMSGIYLSGSDCGYRASTYGDVTIPKGAANRGITLVELPRRVSTRMPGAARASRTRKSDALHSRHHSSYFLF